VEVRYIEQVRQQFYSGLIDAPALINEENFNRYGASTTPTFVLIDRNGIVKMYRPGGIRYEELRPRVEALFR
jgi:thioredoxin-related protein